MQLQKTLSSETVNPATSMTGDSDGVGYAQPSLEVLSCKNCNANGNCLVEQMTIAHDLSYQLMKNRKVYLRGEHLFRAEDEADALYVVSSGSLLPSARTVSWKNHFFWKMAYRPQIFASSKMPKHWRSRSTISPVMSSSKQSSPAMTVKGR